MAISILLGVLILIPIILILIVLIRFVFYALRHVNRETAYHAKGFRFYRTAGNKMYSSFSGLASSHYGGNETHAIMELPDGIDIDDDFTNEYSKMYSQCK